MASVKRKPAGKKKRGGKRPGAGRPKSAKPRDIPWSSIKQYAEVHAAAAEIRAGLELTDDMFDASALDKFQRMVDAGHARYRLELRRRIKRRGEFTKSENDGAVNVLSLQARNNLDWDRQIPTQEGEPDLGSARVRLGDLLARAAQQASQTEGRHVTVLELLEREAKITEAAK